MAYAAYSDVQAVVSDDQIAEYVPKGLAADAVFAIHLETAAALMDTRLHEGGFTVPIASPTTAATAWLTACNVALALREAQLARGGNRQNDVVSNVERRAEAFELQLKRIAAGANLADMDGSPLLFQAFETSTEAEDASPFDLSPVFLGGVDFDA